MVRPPVRAHHPTASGLSRAASVCRPQRGYAAAPRRAITAPRSHTPRAPALPGKPRARPLCVLPARPRTKQVEVLMLKTREARRLSVSHSAQPVPRALGSGKHRRTETRKTRTVAANDLKDTYAPGDGSRVRLQAREAALRGTACSCRVSAWARCPRTGQVLVHRARWIAARATDAYREVLNWFATSRRARMPRRHWLALALPMISVSGARWGQEVVKQRVGGAETLRVAALTDVLGGGNAPLAHVASRALGSVGRVRRREQSAATRAECDERMREIAA